ncbi:histone [Candidatus Bathyarchaeota archaeon]|nr:MAG: histone [Candidatus Bathyarchaeota archaeon]
MGELAIAAMHRIIKKAGASMIIASAAREISPVWAVIGSKIGREAIDWAMHASRKTVKAEDIRKAAEKILGR